MDLDEVDWLNAEREDGVPNWAALEAFQEASDLDTVADIKARAREIVAEANRR